MLTTFSSLPALTALGLVAMLAYMCLQAFKVALVMTRLRSDGHRADRNTDAEINTDGLSASVTQPNASTQPPEVSWTAAKRSEDTEALITIMQPILSGDPQLEAMLETNLQVTDARVRFLWLIDQSDPQAQQIAQRILSRNSEQGRARICILNCPDSPSMVNPKAFKLALGLELVETPFTAVVDDDTTLPHNNLQQAIDQLTRCDLYTGLPLFRASKGVGSQLVAHFVNNNSLMTYLAVASLLPPVTINGMFYVAKTEYLKTIQAFKSIEKELCDDLALATLVKRSGGTIHQGTAPLELRVTVQSAKHYCSIMHRWFVFADILTTRQSLVGQFTLGVLLGLPAVLLWLSILSALTSTSAMLACIFVLIVRHVLIRSMLRATRIDGLPMNFVWSLVSELLQPIHFVHAKLVRRISWRHRVIQVLRDGSFREV